MVAECKVDTHDTTLPSVRALQGLPMPLGSVLAGQYRLEELLGAGGMGTVYRACQLSVERQVAVKLISGEHETPEHVERFRREAAALAKLRHPNTVHLLDFGVADAGRPFIVMELLSGTDLEEYLAQNSLTVHDALLITRQIARALSEAHAVGVIHRDLKPSNIYISHVEGGDSFVKVMDFGVAGFCDRAEHSTLTVRGAVVGTAAYMSPEQAQGMEVDARVDVYSLGVILFELLVGRTPPRLSECKPEYAEQTGLQSLLDRLLAKAPAERPASAGEVLILLDELIEQLASGTDSERLTGPKLIAPKRRREGRATWLLAAAALVLLALSAPYSPPSAVASLLPLWAATQAFFSNAHEALSALGTAAGLASEVRIVTVASVPSAAKVSLGGAELGVTPYPLQLKRATSLRVEAPGYEPTTLTVEPHGEPNIVVKLSPLPPLRDAE
ncbi:MAG TPA: serine/threonine-protein kinase [Polyangiales bacterium]|nr:serine/threonine-protein kinase [Polyangiales bacterium]